MRPFSNAYIMLWLFTGSTLLHVNVSIDFCLGKMPACLCLSLYIVSDTLWISNVSREYRKINPKHVVYETEEEMIQNVFLCFLSKKRKKGKRSDNSLEIVKNSRKTEKHSVVFITVSENNEREAKKKHFRLITKFKARELRKTIKGFLKINVILYLFHSLMKKNTRHLNVRIFHDILYCK